MIAATTRRSEVDLAKIVLALLGEMGFDCYQEVPLGARADIVGVLAARTVCVVEVKASMNLDVIAQADAWKRYAHWRFVAVPESMKDSDGRRLAREVCEQRGIGVIEIGAEVCKIRKYPALNRSADAQRLIKVLCPEHKTYAAAGSNGKFWSPWRDSVERLVLEVRRQPGILLKDLIETTQHHWSNNHSARGCFARQIEAGLIKQLRLVRDGKQLKVELAL
jgi:hypothetical protein